MNVFLELPSYCGNIFTVSPGCTTASWLSNSNQFQTRSGLECMVKCLQGSYVAALYVNDEPGDVLL